MKRSIAWSWHLLAGVALAYLLGMHMIIMHLDDLLAGLGDGPSKAVSYAAVAGRGRQAAFLVTYVLLLGAALYHGMYGLRTILSELTMSAKAERLVTVLFVLLGIAFFCYGATIAWAAYGAK